MKFKILTMFLLAFSLLAWSGCQDDGPLNMEDNSDPSMVQHSEEAGGNAVADQYIIVLKKGANPSDIARANGVDKFRAYRHALNGFAARITNPKALDALRNNPNVDYIEQDIKMKAFAQTLPTGIDRIEAEPAGGGGATESNADIDVAIIDSGIDSDHPDLNVYTGIHFWTKTTGPPGQRGPKVDNNYDDEAGHGTHVGGTVGAYNNSYGVVGVVPGARLWAVRVLDANGDGYLSDIISGIDFVTENANAIEVANMSLGGIGNSSAFRTAIQNCVNAGVVVVVAAGNESRDVYGYDGVFNTGDDVIPAAYPEAASISAMVDTDGSPGGNGPSTSYGPDDGFASYSNYSNSAVSGNPVTSPGKAIDLILPGTAIYSTYLNGGYATSSGTSMASPHAAGLAAKYMLENNISSTSAQNVYDIRQALIDNGIGMFSANGFAVNNDPDNNHENLGWAGSTGSQPPVANAGSDITASDGDNSGSETVTLDGSASYDPDGGTLSYVWTYGGATIGTSATINHSFSVSGSPHTVTLTVTDDEGDSDADDVVITINPNQAPVANAGSDRTVTDSDDSGSESVTLDGSGSYDPDGNITSYSWQINGSEIATGVNPTVNLAQGTHTITLVVTDNGDATGSDQVVITVNAPSAQLTVSGINPSSGSTGTTLNVTVSGTGFVSGAALLFEGGAGPSPEVSNVSVSGSTSLTATVTIKSGGPPKTRTWDVRVTNPDGGTDVLSGGFTVNP